MYRLTTLTWLSPRKTAAFSALSVYTIQSCTMSFHAKPYTLGVCVFSCDLPPALLAERPGSFTRYKKLVTDVESHASAMSLLKRAENSAI